MRGKRALAAGGNGPVADCHSRTGVSGGVPGEPPPPASAPAAAVADVGEQARALTREQLVVFWQRRWRRPPPKGISRRLLECNAAWLLQAEGQGGVGAATRRRLNELAEAREDGNGGGDAVRKSASRPKTLRRPLRPGSRLIRQWQGRTHVVDVVDDGFSYDGRAYSSLTAIAFEITGARWSGPRFFGLNRSKTDTGTERSTRKTQAAAPVANSYPSDHSRDGSPDV